MSQVPSPIKEDENSVLIRHSVTGFEQGIAALAGLFTAGPLGALASWATIRGVQGKWTPWFILGIPSALAINAFYVGIFYAYKTIANLPKETSLKASPELLNKESSVSNAQPQSISLEGMGMLDSAKVVSIVNSKPPGLKIAKGVLVYNDGDILTADFRIYCPTSQIRPTNFTLRTTSGELKKQGSWWDKSFAPKYAAEQKLVDKVCT